MNHKMPALDIEPSDVIRLIEQYLKENNLFRTLQSLQDETLVSLNTVDSIETFVHDIDSGRWDVVLKVVKLLKLPDSKLIDLYEQIAIELIELGELKPAKRLIYNTEPMQKLKSISPDRYSILENLSRRDFFDPREAYRDGITKEKRRNAIADALKKEVSVVPPQRLLTLLGDALKWQKHEGLLPSATSIDIFTGKAHMVHAEEETYPNSLHKHCIKPVKNIDSTIFVWCAEFSPDGHYMVLGYSTGLVEIRNSTTGRLANDLRYQAQKNFIITPSKEAAVSMCFSASEKLAVGDRKGNISIWDLTTGQPYQIFNAVHNKAVKCLAFKRNGKEILSGSGDSTVKLHGVINKSKILDLHGHKSFVNSVAFSRDEKFVISGSSDQTVKIWNAKTSHLLHEYRGTSPIHTVLLMPHLKSDIFLIGDSSRKMQLIDLEGKIRTKLCDEIVEESEVTTGDIEKKKADEDELGLRNFKAVCASPKGNFIYAVDFGNIYCFNYSSKKVQKRLIVHEDPGNELTGVKHHPFINLLVTFDTKGNLQLWRP